MEDLKLSYGDAENTYSFANNKADEIISDLTFIKNMTIPEFIGKDADSYLSALHASCDVLITNIRSFNQDYVEKARFDLKTTQETEESGAANARNIENNISDTTSI